MRGRSVVVAFTALVVAGSGSHAHLEALARDALAPAYDASTQMSLRNLGLALQSVALVEGDLHDVTTSELAGWGWTPGDHLTVTVHVQDDRFWAVGHDVRPGAGTFAVSNSGGTHVQVSQTEASAALAPEAGVRIVRGGLPSPGSAQSRR